MKKTRILSFALAIVMLFAFAAVSVSAMTGDINDDNEITAQDYMMVKRYVLGTFKLNETQSVSADINCDGEITAQDYMMVKRAVLGTYQIGLSNDPIVRAVETVIENKGKLETNYTTSYLGNEGDATVSFKRISGMLHLCGKVKITAMDAVVEIKIPLNKILAKYSLSGKATAKAMNIDITGTLVAAEYSVDNQEIDVKFTATNGADISAYEKVLPGLCKTAMDEFLYKADELLIESESGVDIGDFGFETFYNQLHPSFDEE